MEKPAGATLSGSSVMAAAATSADLAGDDPGGASFGARPVRIVLTVGEAGELQPKGARLATVPGVCKGNAHKHEHLGIGRHVLVSRKWSGKALDDHRAERAAFVRQLLDRAGVRPGYAVDGGPFELEKTKAGDPDVPTRPALLLQAISERQRWKADYDAAQLATGEPSESCSATTGEAA